MGNGQPADCFILGNHINYTPVGQDRHDQTHETLQAGQVVERGCQCPARFRQQVLALCSALQRGDVLESADHTHDLFTLAWDHLRRVLLDIIHGAFSHDICLQQPKSSSNRDHTTSPDITLDDCDRSSSMPA